MIDGASLQLEARRIRIPACIGSTGLLVALAAGTPSVRADERVPLSENFSSDEDDGIALVVGLTVTLELLQGPIADPDANARPPVFGAPPAFDRAISNFLYRGPNAGEWMGGVPDKFGLFVWPGATIGFYAADELAFALRGESLTGDANPDHKLLAFVEGYSLALGLGQVTKLSLGRERPSFALGRPGAGPITSETYVSFFSGHANSSFFMAAFIDRDLSDWLLAHPLADASPAEQLWLGEVLPAFVLYGAAAWVGLSRIVDQQHYFTDVMTGALVGTATANLAYSLHFDSKGRPRRRHPHDEPAAESGLELRLIGVPGGIGVAGRF